MTLTERQIENGKEQEREHWIVVNITVTLLILGDSRRGEISAMSDKKMHLIFDSRLTGIYPIFHKEYKLEETNTVCNFCWTTITNHISVFHLKPTSWAVKNTVRPVSFDMFLIL